MTAEFFWRTIVSKIKSYSLFLKMLISTSQTSNSQMLIIQLIVALSLWPILLKKKQNPSARLKLETCKTNSRSLLLFCIPVHDVVSGKLWTPVWETETMVFCSSNTRLVASENLDLNWRFSSLSTFLSVATSAQIYLFRSCSISNTHFSSCKTSKDFMMKEIFNLHQSYTPQIR